MPFYEYQCNNCGKLTEVLQKISDPRLTQCGDCGADALIKLVSKTSFKLKGSGWYVSDFRGDKPSAKDKARDDVNTDAAGVGQTSTVNSGKADSTSQAAGD